MFGVGFSEVLVIGVIALIFVGPKRLPDLARQAGRFFVQFKRMTSDVRGTVDGFIKDAEDEIRREEREAIQTLLSVAKPEIPVPSHSTAMDHHHAYDGDHPPEGPNEPPNQPVDGDKKKSL